MDSRRNVLAYVLEYILSFVRAQTALLLGQHAAATTALNAARVPGKWARLVYSEL